MDVLALAERLTEAAKAIDKGFLLYVVVAFLLLVPRGRRINRYNLFIAADPQTVWSTYFFHVGHHNYRPGLRFLSCDILAEKPLTIRYVVQADYTRRPSTHVFTYDVYEPYSRYRLSSGDNIVEEGELQREAGGTWLRVAITAPARGWLIPLALRRRHERSYRALKDVCEGRAPEAPRNALTARWWDRWIMTSAWLALVAVFTSQLAGVPPWPAMLFLAVLSVPLLIRWTKVLSRLFVLR